MRKKYFRTSASDPQSLRCRVERVVRFEEVDALGIVWHGRYPSYFEDGRVLLGEQYGLGYMVDYQRPLRFGETFSIEAILHWSDAVRLNHEFILRNAAGEVTTTGYTVQLLMDQSDKVLMLPPTFYEEFRQRWQAGELA